MTNFIELFKEKARNKNVSKEDMLAFTKRDGSERVMICTLMDEYLPETANLAKARDPREQDMNVWDVEKQGWRGFKMFSVISVELDHAEVRF